MARKPKLTPTQEQEVCDRYRAKESCQRLADEFGVSAGTIKNILVRHGIDRTVHFRNLTVAEIWEVHRRYREGETSYQLAAEFGVSRPAICAHLRNEKNPKRSRHEASSHYVCSHNYFSNVETPEQAYALGLIATDGCVNRTYGASPELVIVLKAADKPLLEAVNLLIGSNRPVRTYEHKGYSFARLAATSQQIASDLEAYGITQRKTFDVRWPDLPSGLYRHFLRGAFDGDGSFFTTQPEDHLTPQLAAAFIGNQHLATAALGFISNHCGLEPVTLAPRYQKNGSLSTLNFRYSGNARCLPIVNLLYEGATIYLPRKRQKVLDHYRSLPKYRDQLLFGG